MSKGKLHPFFSDEKILDVIRDYSNDTIYFKDHQSRFIWNNRSHAAQFGISDPREMVGKTDADYFPKDFATRARKEEMEIMETRIPLISNIEKLEKPDGSVVWYSASKYPIIDEKDNVIGTWGIRSDRSFQPPLFLRDDREDRIPVRSKKQTQEG